VSHKPTVGVLIGMNTLTQKGEEYTPFLDNLDSQHNVAITNVSWKQHVISEKPNTVIFIFNKIIT
jgi:hypothetical protein